MLFNEKLQQFFIKVVHLRTVVVYNCSDIFKKEKMYEENFNSFISA